MPAPNFFGAGIFNHYAYVSIISVIAICKKITYVVDLSIIMTKIIFNDKISQSPPMNHLLKGKQWNFVIISLTLQFLFFYSYFCIVLLAH